MIDYTDCTKEELIEVVEDYASRLFNYGAKELGHFRAYEPTEEDICFLLKEDGLKVKHVESEDE